MSFEGIHKFKPMGPSRMGITRRDYTPMGVPVGALRSIDRKADLQLELKANGTLTAAPKEEKCDLADLIQDWFLFEEWDSEFEQKHGEPVPDEYKFYGMRDVDSSSDDFIYMMDCQGRTVRAFQYRSVPPRTPEPPEPPSAARLEPLDCRPLSDYV